MKKKLMYLFLCGITVLLLAYPQKSVFYAQRGMEICRSMIVPSLFPFFICSGLLIYSGFCEQLSKLFGRVMPVLFGINASGAAAFVLGVVSGYPLGAVTACGLYEKNYLTKTEAERLLAFCNNSGPLFLLGTVGISLYSNSKIGVLLYLAHLLSSVLVGVCFRFWRKNEFAPTVSAPTVAEKSIGEIYSVVLNNSLQSILSVCGTVIFFSVLSNLVSDLFLQNPQIRLRVIGLFEFVTGVSGIAASAMPMIEKMILSAGIVAFAGLSVHMQVLGVVARHGLSLKPYFVGKLLHAFFSMLLTGLFWRIAPQTEPVFLTSHSALSAGFAIGSCYSVMTVCLLAVLVLLFFLITRKKESCLTG